MSKAIYGHLGGSDALLLAEVTRLRRRVRELEEQVAAEAELVGLAGADRRCTRPSSTPRCASWAPPSPR